MSTVILWVIISLIFVSNPALFFLGIILFILYKGLTYQQPNKFDANQPDSPGSNFRGEEQAHSDISENGRFVYNDVSNDPEFTEMSEQIRREVEKNRAQADEDLMAEAEREYAARKRAEELGQTN